MASCLFNGTVCPYGKCALNFGNTYELIAHLEGEHCGSPPLNVIDNEQNKFVRPCSVYRLFPEGYKPTPVPKVPFKLNFETYKKRTTSIGSLALSRMRGSESERTDEGEEGEGEEERKYKCTVEGCDRRYKNLQGVKYHMRSAHNKPEEGATVGGVLRGEGGGGPIIGGGGGGMSTIDGSIAATVGQAVSSSVALGLPPPTPTKYAIARPYKCPNCCKRYKTTTGMQNHIAAAHNKQPTAGPSSLEVSSTSSSSSAVTQSVQDILARSAKEEEELREQKALLEGKTVGAVLQSGLAAGPTRQAQLRTLISQQHMQQQQQPQQMQQQPMQQDHQHGGQGMMQQQQQGYYQQQGQMQPQQGMQPQHPQQQYMQQRTVREEMMEKMERGGGLPPLTAPPQRRRGGGGQMGMQYRDDVVSSSMEGGPPSVSHLPHPSLPPPHPSSSSSHPPPSAPPPTSTVRLLPPAEEIFHQRDQQQQQMGGASDPHHMQQQQQQSMQHYRPMHPNQGPGGYQMGPGYQRGPPVSAGYHHQMPPQEGYGPPPGQQQHQAPPPQRMQYSSQEGDGGYVPSPRPLPSITSSFTQGNTEGGFQYAPPPSNQYGQPQQGYGNEGGYGEGYGQPPPQQQQHYDGRPMEHHDYSR